MQARYDYHLELHFQKEILEQACARPRQRITQELQVFKPGQCRTNLRPGHAQQQLDQHCKEARPRF